MAIQVKGEAAICSSVGDIDKHEKFKKLSKNKRIEKLQEVYDKYGVYSNEFYIQVKPLIMWTIYRNLRGMSTNYLEDLVNNAYEELIIAFEGGQTTYYNKPIYKNPYYGSAKYKQKYKNIGDFIMAVTGSSVAKYRSKTFKRKCNHEDDSYDLSERVNFTNFEEDNGLDYTIKEPEYTQLFTKFSFDLNFLNHLRILKMSKPRNNVLYNFMLWKESINE